VGRADAPRGAEEGRPDVASEAEALQRAGDPGFTEDSVKELREEAPREGMQGISPRYIQDKISNTLVSKQSIEEGRSTRSWS
jgi:predicted Ser/Thr protein kinase